MFQLGKLARYQTPLLDRPARRRAGPQQARHQPAPASTTAPAVRSPPSAAPPTSARRALANSQDEIAALNQASTKAYPAADHGRQVPGGARRSDERGGGGLVRPLRPPRAARRGRPAGTAAGQEAQRDPTFTALHGNQTVPCRWANGSPPAPIRPAATPATPGSRDSSTTPTSRPLAEPLRRARPSLGITLVSAPGANNACGYQTGPDVPEKQGDSGNTNLTNNPRDFAECAGDPRRPPARHQLRPQPLGPVRAARPLRRLGLPAEHRRQQRRSDHLRPEQRPSTRHSSSAAPAPAQPGQQTSGRPRRSHRRPPLSSRRRSRTSSTSTRTGSPKTPRSSSSSCSSSSRTWCRRCRTSPRGSPGARARQLDPEQQRQPPAPRPPTSSTSSSASDDDHPYI